MPASASHGQDKRGLEELEVKFQSAVKLIRSLPKQGQFQPSYDDASKVYGYYKQAKIGQCDQPKPGFWDVVGRAKWNAWSQLGDMSKDEAKECYVVEIKRIYEKLSTSDEFLEQQQQLSDIIIPFCEATGFAMPKSIKEGIAIKSHIAEKNKKDNLYGMNGYTNGHFTSSHSSRNDTLGVVINGNDVKIMKEKGNDLFDAEQENSFEFNEVSILSETSENLNGNGFGNGHNNSTDTSIEYDESTKAEKVAGKHIATIEQDSSDDDDDDIYCDSINPDDVSGFISFNTTSNSSIEKTVDTTHNDLTCITDDSSLLRAESPQFCGQNGANAQVHSTPSVVIKAEVASKCQEYANAKRPQSNLDFHVHEGNVLEKKHIDDYENSQGSIGLNEETTDISSSMTSNSATDSSVRNNTARKDNRRMEHELHKAFAKRVPKSNHETLAYKEAQQDSDGTSQGLVKSPNCVDKGRNFVINARGGSSQGDLAGSISKTGSSNRLRSDDNTERLEAGSTGKGTKQRSRRSRRRRDDSSSDSDTSSSDSRVKSETIGEQIVRTLQRLEQDMQMVLLKLNSIEEGIRTSNQVNRRNPWTDYLPSRRVTMMLLWPIIINIVFAYWRRRARAKR